MIAFGQKLGLIFVLPVILAVIWVFNKYYYEVDKSSVSILVLNGNLFRVGDQQFRLHAINSPKSGDVCHNSKGDTWNCGLEAKEYLHKILHIGQVKCRKVAIDSYQNIIAVCEVNGTNVNSNMVRYGYAFAYRKYGNDYIDDEKYARINKLGIWRYGQNRRQIRLVNNEQHNKAMNRRNSIVDSRNDVQLIDGDSFKIGDREYRLFGIDAPEFKQLCYDKDGRSWGCGVAARDQLLRLIGGNKILCRKRDIDRYQRIVSICRAGSIILNSAMVKNGYAVAYTKYGKNYVADEIYARNNKLGIWQGSFEQPVIWRKKNNR